MEKLLCGVAALFNLPQKLFFLVFGAGLGNVDRVKCGLRNRFV
jgi:hypothetical protein